MQNGRNQQPYAAPWPMHEPVLQTVIQILRRPLQHRARRGPPGPAPLFDM